MDSPDAEIKEKCLMIVMDSGFRKGFNLES
jgi:hypothetical protein